MRRRLALAACLTLLIAPAVTAGTPEIRAVEVFSAMSVEVAAVGERVALEVEILAVADDAGEDALATALEALDLDLPDGLRLDRWTRTRLARTGDIVEIRRRAYLRAARAGVFDLPAVPLALPGDAEPHMLPARRLHVVAGAPEWAAAHVVPVRVERAVPGARFARTGSAFLAAPDVLVTAFHVVANAGRVQVTLPDGSTLSTTRAWSLDAERDVALLHIDAERARRAGLRVLPLAPPDARAAVAFTAGWVDGVQHMSSGVRFSGTEGVGSAARVSANAVRPGDSGGPLLDAAGRVLGVVLSGRSSFDDRDLVRQDVCLAADLAPVLAARPDRPRSLRAARPDAPTARALDAVDHLAAGREHLDALRAAAAADDDPLLQFLAGSVFEEAGARQDAAAAFRIARAAGYIPATYALAHQHLRAGDAAAAEPLFAEVAAATPYARLGAMGRARALSALGHYRSAEAELNTVLDSDARFAPALYLLGVVRLAQGREDAARALAVRLARRPAWAAALRGPIEHAALRPTALEAMPLVALR